MIVIHGDNIIKSKNKLLEIINQAKENNILVERLSAQDLTLPLLESKLQKTDLFGHNRMIVIEELHSQRRSKKRTALMEKITASDVKICLWEKRELTANMLKKIGQAEVHKYKLANSLFTWLDSLSPKKNTKAKQIKLLRQAVVENDEYMCFAMLMRQVRMLIQATGGGKIKAPYFVIRKINSQAKKFTLKELLSLHQQLYELDNKIKTSANHQPLTEAIELIIVNL